MITRLILIILCYLYYPFRGKATGDIETNTAQKILILNLSQLGDMISATPLLHHVKKKYSSSRLYVSGKASNKELLEYNEDVDEYIEFDERKLWSFFKLLKTENIDIAILIQTNFGALATLYLSGIKHIIAPTVVGGYSPFETKSYRLIRRFVTILPKHVGKNALEEHLTFLHPLGITEKGTTRHLGFSEEGKRNALAFFAKHNISPKEDFVVAISPSSGNKIKNWPSDRFSRVADYVCKKYNAKILIIGGPNDTEEVSGMMDSLSPQTKVVNTLNLFTVDELKSVISFTHLFISVDAGPLYIAIAFNVPTIDILGPAPEWAVPSGEFTRTISNRDGAEPAILPLNNRDNDFKEARRQAEAITVDMVTREVDDLYIAIQDKVKTT